LRAVGILSALVLALSLRAYEQRLIGKASKIEETLKARREIEKATRIIMSVRNMSEADAYQFIRKQASGKRVSTSVIANSIISAQEMLDGLDLQKGES
jgi:AmiR/NasT family two-component response regulator